MGMAKLPDHITEEAPLEERYLYPGQWWRESGKSKQDQMFLAMEQFPGADGVAITDNDADGLGSMAILEAAYPDKRFAHVESGHGSSVIPPADALDLVAQYGDDQMDIYVMDIAFNDDELDDCVDALEKISRKGTTHVYDHHEWSPTALGMAESVVDDLRIINEEGEDEVCTANIVFEAVREDMEENNPDSVERMEDLAWVTRDHDLWRKQHDISDDLSDYAFWADTDEYIDGVREHGPYIMEDDKISVFVESEREEKQRRIELAVENADWVKLTPDDRALVFDSKNWGGDVLTQVSEDEWDEEEGLVLALAYGSVYASGAGNALNEGRLGAPTEADIAGIIPPWNKASFRSTEDFPYCADIASELNGGGHKTAAGCSPNVVRGEDAYYEHWETYGAAVKETIVDTMLSLELNRE